MFQASAAHHQDVSCMYEANDASKMTVSEPDICHIHITYFLMMGR
jgi:hypothetical protein